MCPQRCHQTRSPRHLAVHSGEGGPVCPGSSGSNPFPALPPVSTFRGWAGHLLGPGRLLTVPHVGRGGGGPAKPLSVRGVPRLGRGQTLSCSNIHPHPPANSGFTEGELTAQTTCPATGSSQWFCSIQSCATTTTVNVEHFYPPKPHSSAVTPPSHPGNSPRRGILSHTVAPCLTFSANARLFSKGSETCISDSLDDTLPSTSQKDWQIHMLTTSALHEAST